jgi:hypothetical protein
MVVMKCIIEHQTWVDSLDKRPKHGIWTWDLGCGMDSFKGTIQVYVYTRIRGVQEVRWEGDGTEPAGECTFFYGKGNENHELRTGSFEHKRIISAVKRTNFLYLHMLSKDMK